MNTKKIYKIQYLVTGHDCWGRIEYEWIDYYKEDFFESKETANKEIERIKENDEHECNCDFRYVEVNLWS